MKVFLPMRSCVLLFSMLLSLSFYTAHGQQPLFGYDTTPRFLNTEGRALRHGLSGGLNAPQYSTIDLNADGIQDLVLFDRTADRLLTFLRSGDQWQYAPQYEHLFPADLRYWVLLRDMNCDGRKDLVTSAGFGIDVYLNIPQASGSITWEKQETLRTETQSGDFVIPATSADLPAIDDIDGDGDPDILVFDFSTGTTINYNRNLSVETSGNCGSLRFRRETREWGGVRECTCGVLAFEQACAPSDGRQGARLQHAGGKSLTTADFDGDGDKDLMLGDETCQVFYYLENVGTTATARFDSFTTTFPRDTPARPGFYPSGYVEDLDGDGVKELIVSSGLPRRIEVNAAYRQSNWLYSIQGEELSLQTKEFLQGEMVDLGEQATIMLADVDGDGDQDLLAASYGTMHDGAFVSTVSLFQNNTEAGGTTYRLIDDDYLGFSSLGVRNLKIASGRVNDDGLADLVFMASDTTGFVTKLYYVPATESNFSFDLALARELSAEAGFNTTFALEDVDSDGLDDLIVGRQFGSVAYYRNTGGAFQLQADPFLNIDDDATRSRPHMAFADFNGDGARDMIVADFSGHLTYYSDYRNYTPSSISALPVAEPAEAGEVRLVRTDNRSWLAGDNSADLPGLMVATARGGFTRLQNRLESSEPGSSGPLTVQAFPNPARAGFIRIRASQTCIIDIMDAAGREVLGDYQVSANDINLLPVNLLPDGLYFVRARTNEEVAIEKFLKYE
ncbi:T9SS type A sorting domain-containing protein [Roseivirga sp. BDSF3-8]|uniref:T9SS type A sorting domain-containing protein n=1 Tax=Roseivirga sp. BDSF3-8 TaxID=3241598 RepID=UPI0035319565